MNLRLLPALLTSLLGLFGHNAFSRSLDLPPPPPSVLANQGDFAAAPSSFGFSRGISISEFSRIVFQDVLKEQFVFSPELLSLDKQVGVSTKLDKSTALSVLTKVLSAHGFAVTKTGGINYVSPVVPPPEVSPPDATLHNYAYAPAYRSILDFQHLEKLYKDAVFSFPQVEDSAPSSAVSFQYLASPALAKSIAESIASIDVKLPNVSIRAYILEVNSDSRDGGGVSLAANLLGGRLKLDLGSSSGSNALTVKTSNITAVVDLLRADSRFKAEAFPYLRTQHSRPATLASTISIPISKVVSDDKGLRTQTVEYMDVGTNIELTPLIVGGTVTLDVKATLSDVATFALGSTTSPTLLSRAFTSSLNLNPGDVIVLGGLTTKRTTDTTNSLFSFNLSQNFQSQLSEIVLVLQADLVE